MVSKLASFSLYWWSSTFRFRCLFLDHFFSSTIKALQIQTNRHLQWPKYHWSKVVMVFGLNSLSQFWVIYFLHKSFKSVSWASMFLQYSHPHMCVHAHVCVCARVLGGGSMQCIKNINFYIIPINLIKIMIFIYLFMGGGGGGHPFHPICFIIKLSMLI